MSRIAELIENLRTREFAPGTWRALIFALTTLSSALLLSGVISNLLAPTVYRKGEVAQYTMRAPREVLIEDTIETEKRQAAAMAAVRHVFSFDEKAVEQISVQLKPLFNELSQLAARIKNGGQQTRERSKLEREFNVDFGGEEWKVVLDPAGWETLQQAVIDVVQPILRRGVISNKVALDEGLQNGAAALRNVHSRAEQDLESAGVLYSMEEAQAMIRSSRPSSVVARGDSFSSVVEKLALFVVHPNVTYDAHETMQRIETARSSVKPTYTLVRRGEVISRAGDVVTPAQEWRLQQLSKALGSRDFISSFSGYFLLTGLVLLLTYSFVHYFWNETRLGVKDLGLAAGVLVLSLVGIKTFSILASTLGDSYSHFDSETYILATPLAAGGILLQVTVGAAGVFLYMISFALLTGIFLKNSWLVLLLIIAGNAVGAIAVRKCSRRSAFIAAGARVALVNMFIVLCFLLIHSDFSWTENAGRIFWAFAGGALSGILGGGLTPIAEFFGRYITDIKLLELASLDRPLLRDLSVQAPGTWNHSMVLGQMAESASEAIGANGLLARVGAYYHDIGKTNKPAYFAENQTGENRHDKLTASMSALIIKSHVKDGLEMAKEHRLPQAILDFIPQHHGTSLISYFYTKAMKDADKDEIVDEGHYRYNGPKPQSKETGILMLADQVEASSRTLADPSPAKIQGLVQKIINRVFSSGELDECDLTLRDLHLIAKTFTRVLTGIYHRRVEYSEPAEKTRENKNAGGAKELKDGNAKRGEALEIPRLVIERGPKEFGNTTNRSYANRNSDAGSIERAPGEEDSEGAVAGHGEETLKRLGML